MASSQPRKRSLVPLETEKPPSKRRVRSCEACRRLKTRCEIQSYPAVCHRCRVLKLECSLDNSAAQLPESPKEQSPQTTQSSCECSERLLAVESSLSQLKELLEKRLPDVEASSPRSARKRLGSSGESRSPPRLPLLQTQIGPPLIADRNSRIAPMSLIRDMKQHILGGDQDHHDSDTSEDIVAKGIITEEMTRTLAAGFTQLSRRWLFMQSSNPMTIRQTSPLLFASCVLAGLHINPSLHGSNVHQALYHHVSGLLGKSMLVSPLSLEAIQAMFIFSMWNLVPNKDTEHIDTWLLSGMAAMHGMLAINFEQLVQGPKNAGGKVDSKTREAIRTWNLICLIHLQFSVGTGRPPVIWHQYLKQCDSILTFPSYDSRDQLVAAGVRLYDSLCRLVNSDSVQTNSLIWEEIDEWKLSCGPIFELDSSKPLRFAYSCSYLILTRRTLKHVSESPPTSPIQNEDDIDTALYIQLAIHHAHRILTLFAAMSVLTAHVRPAYENLLCSYAMVTLSEFASYLDDLKETLDLMEKAYSHVQLGGKAEPVGRWALNVLRKFSLDEQKIVPTTQAQQQNHIHAQHAHDGSAVTMLQDQGFAVPQDDMSAFLPGGWDVAQWGTGVFGDQEFPSLEDMFVGF